MFVQGVEEQDAEERRVVSRNRRLYNNQRTSSVRGETSEAAIYAIPRCGTMPETIATHTYMGWLGQRPFGFRHSPEV